MIDDGGKKKPKLGILFGTFGAVILIFGGMLYLLFGRSKNVNAGKYDGMSQDEIAIAQAGEEKVQKESSGNTNINEEKFSSGFEFNEVGDVVGSKQKLSDGNKELTLDDLLGNSNDNDFSSDISAINKALDVGNLGGFNSGGAGYSGGSSGYSGGNSMGYSGGSTPVYSNDRDADLALKSREVQKADRDASRESSLAFSEKAGISADRRNVGSKEGADSGRSGPEMPDIAGIMQAAMGANNAGDGTGAGGGKDNFKATERPLISQAGFVSDMRVGGDIQVVVPEGKFLDGVVVNAVETSFHDQPVQVVVARDFYDRDGRYVLIPQGSKIMGLAFRVQNFQQQRMFITFHRVLFPDGRSVYFPERQLPEGFSVAGLFGADARVNNHWWRKFGTAIGLGVIEGLAIGIAGGDMRVDPAGGQTISARQRGVEKGTDSLSEVSKRMMDHYSNFAPTITIKSGARIKIYFSEDVLLNAYSLR